ncbi:class I SAM-dependent RNA methyltransferase [Actinomyces ruminicola]|uniref:tRNA/tmRNA/rRNA uracil-C5-methylase, TrmA/RlmC/RlmD family n=1 Tax=Actinomyces ruminicola TaxID=332524 RepID=A0A1G9UAZ1_9ACTO|nr:class I SAM-dependent RNA methyltransferase [Actinomyces ruminicola]SDM56715.1 tRNA/tmRNA/rRNA uracil-C5-methylase, TrmA/RlmC/RlmD family [Actinomyces ruminicola]
MSPHRRSAPPRPPAPVPATPEYVTLAVGAPAHGGHCIARPVDDPSGRIVFVRHALPGEQVRAVMTEKNAKIWRADAIEILSASPDRVRPVWAEAGPGGVGGGELSHVALPAQRTWKRWVLADCLRRIGGAPVVEAVSALPGAEGGAVPVEPMPGEAAAEADPDPRVRARAGTGTRTRISLAVTESGEAGMHGFRSGTVLPVHELPLAVGAIQDLGLTERALWRKHFRPGMRVDAVAPSAGEPLVLLEDGGRSSRALTVLTATGRATGRRRVAEVVDAAGLSLGELHYSVHATGFWQAHRESPTVLVDRVVRGALAEEPTASGTRPGDGPLDAARMAGTRVLELYSGAGLFTLPLVALTGAVRSLEGSGRAVADARRTLHEYAGAELTAGRVTPAAVAQLGRFGTGGPSGGDGADVVVLDPPRQGAGRGIIQAVAALNPRRVVMVACDPAALARDLGTFLGSGYRLAAMSALDMFPHTHHFETIAVLQRN